MSVNRSYLLHVYKKKNLIYYKCDEFELLSLIIIIL